MQSNLAAVIVDNLTAEQRRLSNLNLNADGTVTVIDKTNYIQINSGSTGLDVSRPSQSDTETSAWSLDGN